MTPVTIGLMESSVHPTPTSRRFASILSCIAPIRFEGGIPKLLDIASLVGEVLDAPAYPFQYSVQSSFPSKRGC